MCGLGGRRPQPVLLEQGVGQHHELAHDRRQGDLRRLAAGTQLGVLAGRVRIAAQRGHGRHSEQPPRLAAWKLRLHVRKP